MAKRKSAAEIEYQKQVRRIKRLEKSAADRGIFLAQPTFLPPKPKKITAASVRKLEKITPKVVYKGASYVDTGTGEVLKVNPASPPRRTKEDKKRLKRSGGGAGAPPIPPPPEPPGGTPNDPGTPPIGDSLRYHNFLAELDKYPRGDGAKILRRWIKALAAERGKEEVGAMLQAASDAGYVVSRDEAYSEAAAMSFIVSVLYYLPNSGQYREDFENSFEYEEAGEEYW